MILRVSIVFLLCIFSGSKLYSQAILQFSDGKNPVPYVSVLDTARKLYLQADSSGGCRLPSGEYHLQLTHVSVETQALHLHIGNNDTAIQIRLAPRSVALIEFRIRSSKIPGKRRLISYGNTNRRSRSSHKIPQDIRAGMVFAPRHTGRTRYLDEISFKLSNTEGLEGADDNLEIRVYRMAGNTIEDQPANVEPIYVPLARLKKLNHVKLAHPIGMPAAGVFVSFELPHVRQDQNTLHLTFVTDDGYETCNEYVGKVVNKTWNGATFPEFERCYMHPYSRKYTQLNIGIRYFDVE